VNEERFEAGLKTRSEVLGQEYVSASLEGADDLTRPLQELVTEYCWGEVWNRDGVERGTRSMRTVSMLIARGQMEELALHARGALTNGVTGEQLVEIVLHSAIYCGVPAAVSAMRVVAPVVREGRS